MAGCAPATKGRTCRVLLGAFDSSGATSCGSHYYGVPVVLHAHFPTIYAILP